ncbi:MAG TPA: diaminopimelate epimerase [Limnochordia bacterium]|nr:diaminopimelate epimerase [Limnochordia bacterium]
MPFSKLHGLGNTYIYLDLCGPKAPTLDWPELARRVSDVHFGLGSDGLILILPGETADFRMRIFNADGSEAQMCGNGIRCVGKYVYDHGLTQKTQLSIETGAGIKTLELETAGGRAQRARVDMGPPRFERGALPMTGDPQERAVEAPLAVAGQNYAVTAVSMGNPHIVTFLDGIDTLDLAALGPQFERHPAFPERTNTEFVEVHSPTRLKMRVWERGSGETWACGTGACAVAVAAALTGRAERKVIVQLLGGPLEIEWAQDERVYMTGPAVEIARGELDAAWLGELAAPALEG